MKIRTTKRVKSEGREKEKLYFFLFRREKRKVGLCLFLFLYFLIPISLLNVTKFGEQELCLQKMKENKEFYK